MTATLEAIESQIRDGELEGARTALASVPETEENRTEALFLEGYLQQAMYDREAALAAYERVLELDSNHPRATFQAAFLCDQGGDTDAAIDLYERCTSNTPISVNALLNLAVLLEETGELAKAEACVESVLAEFPLHQRARQFLKSVKSSYDMLYDEHLVREKEQRDAVLDVPVSDFELSVRARNCLSQMNIRTLGDLLKTTEAELLSYKNFGDTSLSEIQAMLAQQGLSLGQGMPMAEPPPQLEGPPVSPDTTAFMSRSVSELELSVRSRKCLQRLGISTLGELTSRSEAELMATKNFGQTSLLEIKRQLAVAGLNLRRSEH